MIEKLEKAFLIFITTFYVAIILTGLPVLLAMTVTVVVHIFTGEWLMLL